MPNARRHPTNFDRPTKKRQKSQRFAKLKRAAMPPHKPPQIAAHLILPNRTQSPPTNRPVDK
jgi:hypothetical protein